MGKTDFINPIVKKYDNVMAKKTECGLIAGRNYKIVGWMRGLGCFWILKKYGEEPTLINMGFFKEI